ncbi:hypothetical protein C0J52_26769, partial [Blattella germanica]
DSVVICCRKSWNESYSNANDGLKIITKLGNDGFEEQGLDKFNKQNIIPLYAVHKEREIKVRRWTSILMKSAANTLTEIYNRTTTRHHKVRSYIATHLPKANWEVYEKICTSEDGSHSRADIVAINRQAGRGLILDPTIRMEQDCKQAIRVNTEKETIYRPCRPHFSERYNLSVNAWAVKGLLFGSHGTAYQWTADIHIKGVRKQRDAEMKDALALIKDLVILMRRKTQGASESIFVRERTRETERQEGGGAREKGGDWEIVIYVSAEHGVLLLVFESLNYKVENIAKVVGTNTLREIAKAYDQRKAHANKTVPFWILRPGHYNTDLPQEGSLCYANIATTKELWSLVYILASYENIILILVALGSAQNRLNFQAQQEFNLLGNTAFRTKRVVVSIGFCKQLEVEDMRRHLVPEEVTCAVTLFEEGFTQRYVAERLRVSQPVTGSVIASQRALRRNNQDRHEPVPERHSIMRWIDVEQTYISNIRSPVKKKAIMKSRRIRQWLVILLETLFYNGNCVAEPLLKPVNIILIYIEHNQWWQRGYLNLKNTTTNETPV